MTIGGFFGRYLILDLASGKSEIKPLPDKTIVDYLGARGIASKLLFDLQEGGVDPLGDESHLIVFTGPVAGTGTPGSSRLAFVCKSPLGNFINASGMGGRYPIAFKRTGFDGLILKGRSKEKVWLHLTPDGISIHSAGDIWGMKSTEAEEAVKSRIDGKARVCSIGPGGEKQVLFAAIVSETRTAARGGTGTVMGSKNVKAIAVSGQEKTPIVDKDTVKKEIKLTRDHQKENPALIGMQMSGTAGMVAIIDGMGGLPTKNFQTGTFEGAMNFNGATIAETVKVKAVACASCPVACSVISEIKAGKYKGIKTEGPEYETAVMFGSNLGVDDINTILTANYRCDEWGLDTISTGNVIGFAMECFEKGLITKDDTGGLELTWGNDPVVLELVELIGKNEGFGARLAKGVAALSREIPGSHDFAMQVKGLELAAYDPRAVFSQALSYAISCRGGDHGRGGYMMVEFFETGDVDFYTHVGKAKKVVKQAELSAVYDLASICTFNFIPEDLIANLLQAIMGLELTPEIIRKTVRKTMDIERKFNNREGFTKKDDTLPPRLLNEPLPEGTAAGKKVEGLEIMVSEFYEIMGWDEEGNPP